MVYLTHTLNAWASGQYNIEGFQQIIKQEIKTLGPDLLPLQQGLQHSSFAIADNLAATILNVTEEPTILLIKAGLFYDGIINGCSCADDPTPIDTNTEYCEVYFRINKQTASTTVVLIDSTQ